MNSKPRSRKVCAIIVAVVVAAGAAIFFSTRPREQVTANSNLVSYTVKTGNIDVSVHGTGSVAPSESRSYTASVAGQVVYAALSTGDSASEGQLVCVLKTQGADTGYLDSDRATAQTKLYTNSSDVTKVYAPVAGRLKDVKVQENDRVNDVMKKYGYLALISSDDTLKLRFKPSEGTELTPGQELKVQISAKKVTGTISEIGDSDGLATILIDDGDYAMHQEASVLSKAGETVGVGTLEINAPVPVVAWDGFVEDVNYKNNRSVSSGANLIELQQTGYTSSSYSYFAGVYAPINGLLTSAPTLHAQVTTESAADDAAYLALQAQRGYQLVVSVDELDIASIEVGQKATVKADALANTTFEGTVSKVSKVGTSTNNVAKYDVTLTLASSEGLLSGMTASADIATANRQNVLVVPVEALQSIDGKYFVMKRNAAESAGGDGGSAAASDGSSSRGIQRNSSGGGSGDGPQFNRDGAPPDMQSNRNSSSGDSPGGANMMRQGLTEVTVGVNDGEHAEILAGLSAGDVIMYTSLSSSGGSGGVGGMMGLTGGMGGGEMRVIQNGGGNRPGN